MGESLRQILQQRWGDDWLIGLDSQLFWQLLAEEFQQAPQRDSKQIGEISGVDELRLGGGVHPAVDQGFGRGRGITSKTFGHNAPRLIAEADPLRFLTRFLVACSCDRTVVLANPHWGEREWAQVRWGDRGWPSVGSEAGDGSGKILIPTGGSSGQIKFVVHTWATLLASVRGFQAHFGLDPVNAYCVLPLFHVSGLMQVLRVLVSGGQLALQPYQQLKQGEPLPLPAQGFLSLVPTQLQWLLSQGQTFLPWLKSFRAVLLGGAPPWPDLLSQARQAEIPLALTYGMTETASQVATLRPERFLTGAASNGQPLPHAQIRIVGDHGNLVNGGETGRVAIEAQSLALGYIYPENPKKLVALGPALPGATQPTKDCTGPAMGFRPSVSFPLQPLFLTDDLGVLDAAGELHILGRSSSKLITGGENVFPEEVEGVVLAVPGVRDACLVGLPDARWGQRLCALVVFEASPCPLQVISVTIQNQLAAYKHPKIWVAVPAIPRTAQGKVNRKRALELAQTILGIYEHRLLP